MLGCSATPVTCTNLCEPSTGQCAGCTPETETFEGSDWPTQPGANQSQNTMVQRPPPIIYHNFTFSPLSSTTLHAATSATGDAASFKSLGVVQSVINGSTLDISLPQGASSVSLRVHAIGALPSQLGTYKLRRGTSQVSFTPSATTPSTVTLDLASPTTQVSVVLTGIPLGVPPGTPQRFFIDSIAYTPMTCSPAACSPNPCKNGGTCSGLVGGGTLCSCAAGYSGPTCETTLDPCALGACLNGAACTSSAGSYACDCLIGWTGSRCETNACNAAACDDSNACTVDACNPSSQCESTAKCAGPCNAVTGDCVLCADLYEGFEDASWPVLDPIIGWMRTTIAPLGNTITFHGTKYAMTPGMGALTARTSPTFDPSRFRSLGVQLDSPSSSLTITLPQTATRVALSVHRIGMAPLMPATKFVLASGASTTTFTASDTQVSVVSLTLASPAKTVTVSLFTPQSIPSFPAGRTLLIDAIGYEPGECPANDCASAPCENGGTCADEVGRFLCSCAPGFSGTTCAVNIDDCVSHPCAHGGTCIDGIASYTCECAAGWEGTNCTRSIDDCVLAGSGACNHGTCVDHHLGYTCTCQIGFVGADCSVNFDDCAVQPCLNGAACTDGIAAFTCDCAPGWSGATCATEIDECAPAPCAHGGACTDGLASFTCACTAAWTGETCSDDVDECATAPCLNGGVCTNLPGSFACACTPGYAGTLCETEIDECATAPCQHGGTCVDLVAAFSCDCLVGYGGATCATVDCDPNPCANGGQCKDDGGLFSCQCAEGFVGPLCECGDGQLDPSEVCDDAGNNGVAFAVPGTPNASLVFADHAYGYYTNGLTWAAASAQCTSLGGTLVSINNGAEAFELREWLHERPDAGWIGAHSLAGKWQWADPTVPFWFTSWLAGLQSQSCARWILGATLWSTEPCNHAGYVHPYTCEFKRSNCDAACSGRLCADGRAICPLEPTCLAAEILPTAPSTDDAIQCSCTKFDGAAGMVESGSLCRFEDQKGALLAPEGSCALPAGAAMGADGLRCTLTPSDGTSFGAPVITELGLINRAPQAPPAVTLGLTDGSPLTVLTASQPLRCASTSATLPADPDGDSVVAQVAWSLNGSVAHVESGLAVPAHEISLADLYQKAWTWGQPERGDVVACAVGAFDGKLSGAWTWSPSVVAGNAAPGVVAPVIAPEGPLYAGVPLTCTVSAASDADGDTTSLTLTWRVDGVSTQTQTVVSGQEVALATSPAVGKQVECRVVANDGHGGVGTAADTVTVENQRPGCLSAAFSPAKAEYTDGDTITCGCLTVDDFDGDTSGFQCLWRVSGALQTWSGCSVSASSIPSGQVVECDIAPTDFEGPGAFAKVTGQKAGGQGPTWGPNSVTLTTPSAGYFGIDASQHDATFVCSWTSATDPDGAEITYKVNWRYQAPTGQTKALLGTSLTTITLRQLTSDQGLQPVKHGDVWCEVTASDGSGVATQSSNVYDLRNHEPVFLSSGWDGSQSYPASRRATFPGELRTCSGVIADYDGDATLRLSLRYYPSFTNVYTWAPYWTTLHTETHTHTTQASFPWAPGLNDANGMYFCDVMASDPETGGNGHTWESWLAKGAPQVTSIGLSPASSSPCESRVCTVSLTHPDALTMPDQDSNLHVGLSVRWLADGVAVATTHVKDVLIRPEGSTVDIPADDAPVGDGQQLACEVSVVQGPLLPPVIATSNTVIAQGEGATVGTVFVSHAPRVGEAVHCMVTGVANGCAITPSPVFEWVVDGLLVDGAVGGTLSTSGLTVGQTIACRVRLVDGGHAVSPEMTSASVSVVSDTWTLNGSQVGMAFGSATTVVPDRDGDGRDELLVGAPGTDTGGKVDAGLVYVVPGQAQGGVLTSTTLDGGAALLVVQGDEGSWDTASTFCAGVAGSSQCGTVVPGVTQDGGPTAPRGGALGFRAAVVPDADGDDVPDLLLSAPYGSMTGTAGYLAGRVVLASGAATGTQPLSALLRVRAVGEAGIDPVQFLATKGLHGSAFNGHLLGWGLAGGDFDGDGRSDVAMAAPNTDFPTDASDPSLYDTGRVYVVGSIGGVTTLDLGQFSDPATRSFETPGFMVQTTVSTGDFDGNGQVGQLTNVGDVNGDGADDLFIDPIGFAANELYVVLGRRSGRTIDPGAGDHDGVFRLGGPVNWVTTIGNPDYLARLKLGRSFEANRHLKLGDVNADGLVDLAVASVENEGGPLNQYEVAVVFGDRSLSSLDLAAVDAGQGGFVVEGRPGTDLAVSSLTVGGVGDQNHDGFDDIGITMRVRLGGPTGAIQDRLYVAFGKANGTSVSFNDLAAGVGGSMRAITGFASTIDHGDLDGDGLDDIILGLPGNSSNRGSVYVIYGRDAAGDLTALGGDTAETFGGSSGGPEWIAAGRGNDTLLGGAGADVLYAGGGDDTIVLSSLDFRRVNGGPGLDTLRLPNATKVDFGALGCRVRDVEALVIGDGGSIHLRVADAARLSRRTHTITVRGAQGTSLALTDGVWTPAALEIVGTETFRVFLSGDTRIRVLSLVDVNVAPALALAAFSIHENSAPGTVVGSLQLSDADGQVALAEVVDPNTPFTIAPGTGQLLLGDTMPLDREQQSVWLLTVRVVDDEGLASTYTVEVSVLDVNEPPVFVPANPTATVEEGTRTNELVTTVHVVDGDPGEHLHFEIIDGNKGNAFRIDDTGRVFIDQWEDIDYERAPVRTPTIRVTDSVGHQVTATLTVHVINQDSQTRTVDFTFTTQAQKVWASNRDSWVAFSEHQEFAWHSDVREKAGSMEALKTTGVLDFDGTPYFRMLTQGVLLNKWVAMADGGFISASLPLGMSVTFPDEIAPGATMVIGSTWKLKNGATFNGLSPSFVAATIAGASHASLEAGLLLVGDDPMTCDTTLKPVWQSQESWCNGFELICNDRVDNDGDSGDSLCFQTDLMSTQLGIQYAPADVSVVSGPGWAQVNDAWDECPAELTDPKYGIGYCIGSHDPQTYCGEAICVGLGCEKIDCSDPDCVEAAVCSGAGGDQYASLASESAPAVHPKPFIRDEPPQLIESFMFRNVYPEGTPINASDPMKLFTGSDDSTDVINRPNLLAPATVATASITEIRDIHDLLGDKGTMTGTSNHPILGGLFRFAESHKGVSGNVGIHVDFTQGYYVEVEGVVATYTLEDGTMHTAPMGEPASFTLPASADINHDGRVQVTTRFAIQARLYNRVRADVTGASYLEFGRSIIDFRGPNGLGLDTLYGRHDFTLIPPEVYQKSSGGLLTYMETVLLGGFGFPTLTTSVDIMTEPNPEVCDNAGDDDADGLVDCADPECAEDVCGTAGRCQSGVCVWACVSDCDDAVACTVDACDAVTRTCTHEARSQLCPDDGIYCNGAEVCNGPTGCGHAGSPCGPGLVCDAAEELCVLASELAVDPALVAAIGDSLTRAFASPCTSGSVSDGLWCMYQGVPSGFPLGGDYPENSWSTGTNPDVYSFAQRSAEAKGLAPVAGANVAVTGATWKHFVKQARKVCELRPAPSEVTVLLGGNDVCDSTSLETMPAVGTLVSHLHDGMQLLTSCLGPQTTIRWRSMARADFLYEAGLAKEAAPCTGESAVQCRDNWEQLGLCKVVTNEPDPLVRRAIGRKIDLYNVAMTEEIERFVTGANGLNPNALTLIGDWKGSIDGGYVNTSFGALQYGACDLSAFDCFHPSLRGQQRLACVAFSEDPLNPEPGAESCDAVRTCGNGLWEHQWGEPCEEDTHCGEGKACNSMCLCVSAVPGTCKTVADCPTDYACVSKKCSPSYPEAPAAELVVETYNAGLAGTFAPALSTERREPIADALSESDADVLCLQEVWRDDDAEFLQGRLAEAFPHTFRQPTSDTNPRATPCGLTSTVATLTCVATKCAMQGVDLTTCVNTECAANWGALGAACQQCLAANVATAPLCVVPPGAKPLQSGGRNGLMLLSKHPIWAPSYGSLGSELLQRGVITATVSGRTVQCAQLTAKLDDVTYLPKGGVTTWEEEQTIQVQELGGLSSPLQCVVLMGDLNSGPETVSLAGESAAAWTALGAAGFSGSWEEPFCTWCGDNSLARNPVASKRLDHVLVRGCPGATVTLSRTMDSTVQLVAGDQLTTTTLSDRYGVRAHIAFGCTPGAVHGCYSGAVGTAGVGSCKAGTHTCNSQGTGFGPCVGEVVPGDEGCAAFAP